ncbi:12774_t:CDS:2 [Cetraspora pellucida]|uniref:12774_t:CDS:1 n=1 Tax=Cetraspora pellucida TaxID=1433469 RepID=A0A9N9ALX8_9GLOM|nr:12774_t:CDS:2 [Cetraspora pellucida]
MVASTSSIKRKAMGQHRDLIIRKWYTEYGCSEVGKLFEGFGLNQNRKPIISYIFLIFDSKLSNFVTFGLRISEFSAKVLPTISLAIVKNVIKPTEETLELLQDFDMGCDHLLRYCPRISCQLKGHCPRIPRHCIKCWAADHRTPSSKLQLPLSSSTPESMRITESEYNIYYHYLGL